MKVIKSAKKLQSIIKNKKQKGKIVGFVPTMGFFHEGHLSLMRKSKKQNDLTVVSIFVNPKQFGPDEDFAKYPRDKKRDELFARREKVDIIFYPSVDEMYPNRYLTYVEVKELDKNLCGAFRPGHFKGVTTVVAKLLNICLPDTLYLGQKDAQQAVIIRKMVRDLNFPLKVKILPTIREKDGLAMSSRNRYLSPRQRNEATVLYKSLKNAKLLIDKGERQAANIKKSIRSLIKKQSSATKIDYIECVDLETLKVVKKLKGKMLIALAVYFGKARLIDNIIIDIK